MHEEPRSELFVFRLRAAPQGPPFPGKFAIAAAVTTLATRMKSLMSMGVTSFRPHARRAPKRRSHGRVTTR
jgi:hypothetical protein